VPRARLPWRWPRWRRGVRRTNRVAPEDLVPEWRTRAAELGLDRDLVRALQGRERAEPMSSAQGEAIAVELASRTGRRRADRRSHAVTFSRPRVSEPRRLPTLRSSSSSAWRTVSWIRSTRSC
jgi:hypothetical protein